MDLGFSDLGGFWGGRPWVLSVFEPIYDCANFQLVLNFMFLKIL